MKYYSTQRPIAPGSFPKQEGNKVLEIHNFDSREYVEAIDRMAWGWIEYEHRLDYFDMRKYELTPLPERELHLKYLGEDSWGRYVYEDENGKLWKLLDCCSPREVCEERGDFPHSSSGNEFDGEPDCPMPNDIKAIYIKEVNDNDVSEA